MTPEQALGHLEDFGTEAVVLRRLNQGPVSRSYLIRNGSKYFVLRIDSPVAAAFCLQRKNEAEVLQAVSAERLGPALVAALPEQGILVTEYVEGRSLDPEELRSAGRLHSIAALLKRVHTMTPVGRPLALRGRLDAYAAQVDPALAAPLVNEVDALLRRVCVDRATGCLCHNDPNAGNFIAMNSGQLRLIDWEYAAIGDPFFDLAVVAQHHDLSPQLIEILLNSYLGTVTDVDRRHLDRFRAIVDRVSLLWLMAVQNSPDVTAQQKKLLDIFRHRLAGRPLP